jgi:hypothetical protein
MINYFLSLQESGKKKEITLTKKLLTNKIRCNKI